MAKQYDLGAVVGKAPIDDTAPSTKKVYSSQKTQHELDQLSQQIGNKANKDGWTAGKFLGTDANGNMTVKDAPESGADPLTIYPVGSIYMSTNSTSPAALFGGTWEQLKDRFLLGAGDNYTLGDTGGDVTHKHNTQAGWDSGSFVHLYNPEGYASVGNAGTYLKISGSYSEASDGDIRTSNTYPASNMPPFEAVNIWKRVS